MHILDQLFENITAIKNQGQSLGFIHIKICQPMEGSEDIIFLADMDEGVGPTAIERIKFKHYLDNLLKPATITFFTKDGIEFGLNDPFWNKLYSPLVKSATSLDEIQSKKELLIQWYGKEIMFQPIKQEDNSSSSNPPPSFSKEKKRYSEIHDLEEKQDPKKTKDKHPSKETTIKEVEKSSAPLSLLFEKSSPPSSSSSIPSYTQDDKIQAQQVKISMVKLLKQGPTALSSEERKQFQATPPDLLKTILLENLNEYTESESEEPPPFSQQTSNNPVKIK